MEFYKRLALTVHKYQHADSDDQLKYRNEIEHLMCVFPNDVLVNFGFHFNLHLSIENYLVFEFNYHHMNDGCGYDFWTSHKAVIAPSLIHGFDLHITGLNKYHIKDHLYSIIDKALHTKGM